MGDLGVLAGFWVVDSLTFTVDGTVVGSVAVGGGWVLGVGWWVLGGVPVADPLSRDYEKVDWECGRGYGLGLGQDMVRRECVRSTTGYQSFVRRTVVRCKAGQGGGERGGMGLLWD